MDITILFKACVKSVRTTSKAVGVLKDPNSKSVLMSSRSVQKDPNLATAKEILKHITQLQKFITENKAAYLNVLNYLSTNKTMTEVDRDHIDVTAEKILHTCTGLIGEYKNEIKRMLPNKSKQITEHYGNVVESLEKYLKSVSKNYTEAKALRVKRVIETHKVAKLEGIKRPLFDATGGGDEVSPRLLHPFRSAAASSLSRLTSTTPVPSIVAAAVLEDDLSVEEMQMFETENELLFNELNSLSEEVRQIESKVVHIAKLQEVFTEKVLQQEQDIDRVSTSVVGATSNLKDANEQIRQAIQRNAGLRVWVLFFLLVMSFSLLFLDWYND